MRQRAGIGRVVFDSMKSGRSSADLVVSTDVAALMALRR